LPESLPAAARVLAVGRDDIGAVDGAGSVVALDADDFVGPVGAVEHRDRPGKALAGKMLLPKPGLVEPDPRLAHETAAGEMDP
jgi:hypothetical protein